MMLAAAALLAQAAPPPRSGLQPHSMSKELRLWLPEAYVEDPLVSHRFERKPTATAADFVVLSLTTVSAKQPEPPPLPVEADLLKADPTLKNLKFTPAVIEWRGRPVATARYEGFEKGNLGVYGRMAWLPLEPGTVVLNIYAEPVWAPTMDQDWDLVLSTLEGPMSALTLRERAPGRWLAAKIVAVLGGLIALAGIIMILAKMNGEVEGPIVHLGLVLPLVPLGYALWRFTECWLPLLVFCAGAGIFGVSLLIER